MLLPINASRRSPVRKPYGRPCQTRAETTALRRALSAKPTRKWRRKGLISLNPDSERARVPAGSESAALVVDFGRRHVVHHREKLVGDRHWGAGLVAIDEEDQAAGIAVNLGERRLVAVG
jgi:hypothetical protein